MSEPKDKKRKEVVFMLPEIKFEVCKPTLTEIKVNPEVDKPTLGKSENKE